VVASWDMPHSAVVSLISWQRLAICALPGLGSQD